MALTFGTVNLSDRTKYKFTEGDDQPNWDIKILKGCGSASFPIIQTFRHVYTIRPYTILCLGTDEDTAVTNRDAVLTQVVQASTRGAAPVYLVRTVRSQTTPDVWTVIGAVPKRTRQYWDGVFKIWLNLDMYVFPGQRL